MLTAQHDDQNPEDPSRLAGSHIGHLLDGSAAPPGLAWSWEIDLGELVEALGGVLDDGGARADGYADDEGQEAALEAELEAVERGGGRVLQPTEMAGCVAGRLPPGPGLAALLGAVPAPVLADHDLPAVAAGFRRIASWATAAELSAVAQIASRAAARDEKIGTDEDGRPAQVSAGAAAEVALAETMSQLGASWWADLAVTLTWRLQATGAALSEGSIDLSRARMIAEATGVLSDDAARAVEHKVLPTAGDLTPGQLRAALRRAVIAADPEGAERRREEAERQARVVMYPDQDDTATLAGQRLSTIHAAAAMARIRALARAWKASGAGGSIDLLSAEVFIGLLCGSLPYIPPAEGAPPDQPPPDEGDDRWPGDGGPDKPPRPGAPGAPGAGGRDRHSHGNPDGAAPRRGGQGRPAAPGPAEDEPHADGGGVPGGGGVPDVTAGSSPISPWEDVPCPGDQDAPRDDHDLCPEDDGAWQSMGWNRDEDDEGLAGSRPIPAWPALPTVLPPAFTRPASAQAGTSRPPAGLLDLALPWSTLAGLSAEPGHLGRIGPITALQARRLAEAASADHAAQWRIIVTSPAGQALAVTRVSRRTQVRDRQSCRDGPAAGMGLVGRVTLTISEDIVTNPPGRDPPSGIAIAALRSAARAAARAREQAQADAAVSGGCAHQSQSRAYRPPPRLQEHVTARDLTCRFPSCRQPAWRGDLDHTIPHDKGGRTCSCNLGPLCRTHHQIKQLRGWTLSQPRPGIFEWITPAGRAYPTTPDIHPV